MHVAIQVLRGRAVLQGAFPHVVGLLRRQRPHRHHPQARAFLWGICYFKILKLVDFLTCSCLVDVGGIQGLCLRARAQADQAAGNGEKVKRSMFWLPLKRRNSDTRVIFTL